MASDAEHQTHHHDQCQDHHEGSSSKEMMDDYYRRQNDRVAILSTLDSLNVSLPRLTEVNSCAMVGCGFGEMELLVIRKCMPNVKQLVAVEPEAESLKQLRAKLIDLPEFQTEFFQDTMQSWQGPSSPVDCILMFHCICNMGKEELQPVFQKFFEKALTHGGVVLIINSGCCGKYAQNYLCKVAGTLYGPTAHVTDQDIRDSMEHCGFSFCQCYHFQSEFNVENRDDAFLSVFACEGECHGDPSKPTVTIARVREVVDEVLGDAKVAFFDNVLLVFEKP